LHGQSPAGPNETGGKAHPPKTKEEEEEEEERGAIPQQPERQFTSGFVCVKARETSPCHKQIFFSKFEVSEFCRAVEVLDWGLDSRNPIKGFERY
jgi:hypothetical protein